MRTLILLIALLSGCRDACETRCHQFGRFINTCGDALAEEGIGSDCFADPEAAVQDDGSVDYSQSYPCTSGAEARKSCLAIGRMRVRIISEEEQAERLAVCEEDSEYNNIIEDEDCDGMIELLSSE